MAANSHHCPLPVDESTSALDRSLIQQGLFRTSAKVLDPGGLTYEHFLSSTVASMESYFDLPTQSRETMFNLFKAGDIAHHRHWTHLAMLVFVFGILGAACSLASRQPKTESLFTTCMRQIQAFKLAFRVGLCSCIMAAMAGSLKPLGIFHTVSAGVTVMIVMEMGSVDRLLVKGFFRGMGTLIGAVEAVLAIKLVETGNNSPLSVYMSILAVSILNASLQLLQKRQGYMYLASNITFVFVFYGYWVEGIEAVVTRVASVFAAVAVALLVDILWPFVWLDSSSSSVNNVVAGTEKVLRKTFAIIDFTFVHDEILAQAEGPETLATTLWRDRAFLPETVDFFRMRRANVTLGDLQRQVGEHAHGKRIANETEIALLHTDAKNAWEDMQFVYWLICRQPPHNYYLLFQRLHAVYAQACSLSHMAYSSLSTSGRALWHGNRDRIETLRVAICSLEPLLLSLVQLCYNDCSKLVDAKVAEIADALEQTSRACEAALQGAQNCDKQDRWRFEAFLMTSDLLVAECSAYVKKILENFGTVHGSAVKEPDDGARKSDEEPDVAQDELVYRLVRLSKHADL